jgi:hypothetical protein
MLWAQVQLSIAGVIYIQSSLQKGIGNPKLERYKDDSAGYWSGIGVES